MSKGSGRRPKFVSESKFAENWERIFGKREPVVDKENKNRNKRDEGVEKDDRSNAH